MTSQEKKVVKKCVEWLMDSTTGSDRYAISRMLTNSRQEGA